MALRLPSGMLRAHRRKGRVVPGTAIVRLSHFRTVRPGFDAVLRESVLPELLGHPGVLRVFAGRQGPDEIGMRILVSVWDSGESMLRAFGGDPDAEPAALDETSGRRVEILPVVVSSIGETLSTGILRIARAGLRDGDLEGYSRLVAQDLEGGREAGLSPLTVVLAGWGERGFVMISAWADWASIEAATGASIADPVRTKRVAGLVDFNADHYELLHDEPGLASLPADVDMAPTDHPLTG
jgi:hypothetical protein